VLTIDNTADGTLARIRREGARPWPVDYFPFLAGELL